MKLDSAYFNMVRAQPCRQTQTETGAQSCQMAGCAASGIYPAPKRRRQSDGTDRLYFCREHIGTYNKAYDFFAHMSEMEILAFQKSAVIGHRPTWRLGTRGPRRIDAEQARDYFNFFRKKREKTRPRPPRILTRRARALKTLGINEKASLHQIKSRFKALVKRYHPDLNGGERKYENRLTAVIRSYHELKKTF